MIIRNEFPEYKEIVEEIMREMYFPNIILIKGKEGETPRNEKGKIIIPSDVSEKEFAFDLIHELGHTVNDPMTFVNYLKCMKEIRVRLGIKGRKLALLGNIISDMVSDFENAKKQKLRQYMKDGLLEEFPKFYPRATLPQKLLWEFYNDVVGLNLPIKKQFTTKIEDIKNILQNEVRREEKYVKIARVIKDILDQESNGGDYGNGDYGDQSDQEDQESGKGSGKGSDNQEKDGIVDGIPIDLNENDVNDIIDQIYEDSKDAGDAKDLIDTFRDLVEHGKGKGFLGKIEKKLPQNDIEHLVRFYETKARIIRRFISYPKEPRYFGMRIGTEKWKFKHGITKINAKKTIYKNGINIPLITSRTSRTMKIRAPESERPMPIDIVISIDVSGSTGDPKGRMDCTADYEVIMLYALLEEAKRTGQKVGLTLWSDYITFTTLPKLYGENEFRKLKRIVFTDKWKSGGTNIKDALEQCQDYKDLLFLVFTDGEVYHDDLLPLDNVVFFLIMPKEDDYKAFVQRYGQNRVIRIDNITKIPKVTLDWFRKMFSR